MLNECEGEHPLIAQVFGCEPKYLHDAVRILEDMGVDGIDLNLGCPAKKVFKNRGGCALTLYPGELVYIIQAMRKATNLHFSAKIRAGVDLPSLNYRLIGDILEGEGCDAVIFHARTRKMGFTGVARWDWIADLKEYLSIPVIGNGDVVDGPSAKRMLDETGCDGVMIGRASYGAPWIFREVLNYLETGEQMKPVCFEERFATMISHLQLAVEYKGPHRGVLEMRKQLGWYLKGCRNVRPLRYAINRQETLEKVINTLYLWRETLTDDPFIRAEPESQEVSASPLPDFIL